MNEREGNGKHSFDFTLNELITFQVLTAEHANGYIYTLTARKRNQTNRKEWECTERNTGPLMTGLYSNKKEENIICGGMAKKIGM